MKMQKHLLNLQQGKQHANVAYLCLTSASFCFYSFCKFYTAGLSFLINKQTFSVSNQQKELITFFFPLFSVI